MAVRTTILYRENAISTEAYVATSFRDRLIGLLGRSGLEKEQALIIPGCAMVHMFFMAFPIDVVFCDKQKQILAFQEGLKPWKLSRYVPSAYFAVEFPVGIIHAQNIQVGGVLSW